MNEAMKVRISRRCFTKEPLSDAVIETIKAGIDRCNVETGLRIAFLENGSEAFRSLRRSYGMFRNVRSLLLMKGSRTDENLEEKVGYCGETLVLRLTGLQVGTCWVGATYDSGKLAIPEGERLVCVIPVGNVQASLQDKLVRAVAASKNRKDIQERIVADRTVPDWILHGLEAVRLAPSALNSQKPTVYYENCALTMKVPQNARFDMVDLGIAKKHFELATGNGKFELGNGGQFKTGKRREKAL